jgi:NAD(P)-dependent dehydrogenase (short-subunit alcohol dehydrogenase family)
MGLSICQQFARQGHRVAVVDLNTDAAQQTAEDLQRGGTDALACAVDVADRSAVHETLAKVRGELGPIEILVTCAGIARWEPFGEISPESWDRVLAVNLSGTFHFVQAALPDMVAARWGRIVTMASSAFQQGSPLHAHYIASKGGVIGLTRAVAGEYARFGITVNTIAPSNIDTPMMRQSLRDLGMPAGDDIETSRLPTGRLGTGDDIAVACLFLCSDEASYITGQLLGINGGSLF